MSYLEDIADFKLKLKKGFTLKKWEEKDCEQIEHMRVVCTVVANMTGRLAALDAPPERRALDKKLARQIFHSFQDITKIIGLDSEEPGMATPKQRQEAAQLDWGEWCGEKAAWLERRAVLLASYIVRKGDTDSQRTWANKRVYAYNRCADKLRELGGEWAEEEEEADDA